MSCLSRVGTSLLQHRRATLSGARANAHEIMNLSNGSGPGIVPILTEVSMQSRVVPRPPSPRQPRKARCQRHDTDGSSPVDLLPYVFAAARSDYKERTREEMELKVTGHWHLLGMHARLQVIVGIPLRFWFRWQSQVLRLGDRLNGYSLPSNIEHDQKWRT